MNADTRMSESLCIRAYCIKTCVQHQFKIFLWKQYLASNRKWQRGLRGSLRQQFHRAKVIRSKLFLPGQNPLWLPEWKERNKIDEFLFSKKCACYQEASGLPPDGGRHSFEHWQGADMSSWVIWIDGKRASKNLSINQGICRNRKTPQEEEFRCEVNIAATGTTMKIGLTMCAGRQTKSEAIQATNNLSDTVFKTELSSLRRHVGIMPHQSAFFVIGCHWREESPKIEVALFPEQPCK